MPSRTFRSMGLLHVFCEILRCILCVEERSHDDSNDESYYVEPLLKSPFSSSNRSLGRTCDVYQSSSSFSPSPTIPSYNQSGFDKKYHFSTSSSSSSKPPTSSSKSSISSHKAPSELPQSSSPASSLNSQPPSSKLPLSPSTSFPSFKKSEILPRVPSSTINEGSRVPCRPSSTPKCSTISSTINEGSGVPCRPSSTPKCPTNSSTIDQGSGTPCRPSSTPKCPNKLPSGSEKPSLLPTKISQSASRSSESLAGPNLHSPISPRISKLVLRIAPSNATETETKTNYVWVEESPIYAIPKEIKSLIEKDKVPQILKQPLSPSTYKDYFAALLYAEEFYLEKWGDFSVKNVVLVLQEAEIDKCLKRKKNTKERVKDEDKTFVAFEIDSIPERRPFLLSRDLVYARISGSESEPFQGIIHRVLKSTKVLVEFGDDFFRKHHPSCRYDISFSFNRVCLKRAHQAVEDASVPLFQNFLFPSCTSQKSIATPLSVLSANQKLDRFSVIQLILRIRRPPPFLVRGPLCVKGPHSLSCTGVLVRDTISKICQTSPDCRILVCAPINRTCDTLTTSLQNVIPGSDSCLFRANAAFREIDGVPIDILPSCLYEGECFTCPSLQDLQKYRVILSTYISSFRLQNAGIAAGYFSHIFLLDATSATEPETMVALMNFADDNTAVIVTGAPGNRSGWIRSDIGRKHGLRKSYFERLGESKQYMTLDPMFIAELDDTFSGFSYV